MTLPPPRPIPKGPRTSTRFLLTSAIRFRRGWFGRPVIQVELLEQTIPWAPPPPGDEIEVLRERRVWRDADKHDIDAVCRCSRYLPTRRGCR